jgi:hypothetical protein
MSKKLSQCGICNCLLPVNNTTGVCKECWPKDDELFDKVRSVMKFGEKFLPEVLAEKTSVDIKHIRRWLNQGRFG